MKKTTMVTLALIALIAVAVPLIYFISSVFKEEKVDAPPIFVSIFHPEGKKNAAKTRELEKPPAEQHTTEKKTHDEIIGNALLEANVDTLKATVIVPHLDVPITNKNVIWCVTFELTADELCKAAESERVKRDGSGSKMQYKNIYMDTPPLDPSSFVAMAGKVEDGIIQKIKDELKRKFNGAASPKLLGLLELASFRWLGYSYLFKDLPFTWQFVRYDDNFSFMGKNVSSFGDTGSFGNSDSELVDGQVKIMDYQNESDFVIELVTSGPKDHLVLAKVPPSDTLKKTVKRVVTKLKYPCSDTLNHETLRIPILNYELVTQYDNVEKSTAGCSLEELGPPISFIQNIRFKLDEKGVALKSEAAGLCGGARTVERSFVFDKPFLVMLIREGSKNPYFAMWVGNPEILVPVGSKN